MIVIESNTEKQNEQASNAIKLLVTIRRYQGKSLRDIMGEVGDETISQELVKTRGNSTHTAKNLKTCRSTVRKYNKRKVQSIKQG